MPDTVLVTGASGYIATHCVQQLIRAGYKVKGTVRSLKDEQKVKPIRDLAEGGPLELVEADLLDASGWADAVAGCRYVLHVASPCPVVQPADPDVLIKPAVEGTLNVLKACQEAKTVRRVVVTSSGAAIIGSPPYKEGKVYTEDDWPDTTQPNLRPYEKSKTLAERAAWDYWSSLPDGDRFELAVVNPMFVFGPVLCGAKGTSTNLLAHFMERHTPKLARISFGFVDVRDVAAAHLAAMTNPEAAGKRHLVSSKTLWMKEIGEICSEEFKSQGYNPPTTEAPYWLLWVVGRWNSVVRAMLPFIGGKVEVDGTRLTQVLKIQPRDITGSIVDMAYSMIENGMIKKTAGYRAR